MKPCLIKKERKGGRKERRKVKTKEVKTNICVCIYVLGFVVVVVVFLEDSQDHFLYQ